MTFDLSILNDDGNSPYLPQQEPVVLHSDFPELIDNTAREQFFVCPQKFFRSTIQKLGPRHTSPHLHFGGAFAAGLETMRKSFYDLGASEQEALEEGLIAAIRYWGDYTPPEDSVKNFENLLLALDHYAETRPLSKDHIKPLKLSSGKHAIEFTFAVPIPETRHPVTGNPILYGGRFDMFAEFQNAPFVEDDKTTSRLGPSWMKQWTLNSQFTGYCLTPDTEVLTYAGWRPISELSEGVEIAQWDNGNIAFVKPTAIHSPDYKGDLISAHGKVNIVGTPDHRQIVYDSYSRSYKTYTLADLPKRSGALRFISAGKLQKTSIFPEDFIRLLAAFQADGSWKDGGAMSFHFSKERKAERLRSILTSLGVDYQEHTSEHYSFRINKSSDICEAVLELLGENKLWGSWLLNLGGNNLETLIEEVQYWDGSSRDTRGWMYFSTIKENADWIRTIASLTGNYSSVHTQEGWKSDKIHYRVNITTSCHHAVHLHTWGAIPWEGKVYCVTVPSSYFLIRKDNQIMVTGNCWAASVVGMPVVGAIIRGQSILSKSFENAEAIIYRPKWQIERWLEQLIKDINRMSMKWEIWRDTQDAANFDYALGTACAAYGGCEFLRLCSSPNPESWIPTDYKNKHWNPLAKDPEAENGGTK